MTVQSPTGARITIYKKHRSLFSPEEYETWTKISGKAGTVMVTLYDMTRLLEMSKIPFFATSRY